MRDIVVLLIFIFIIIASFKKTWYCVLGLAVFSYMNPHTYAWGFARSLPLYYILFIISFFLYLKEKDKQPIFFDWRINAFFLLWSYFFLTTIFAVAPEAAQAKLISVNKVFLPFILTISLINTREKLYSLIVTIACSIGIIAAKGGIFALGTGFSYRVWGPNGTQYNGNNEFALATVIVIPMLILCYTETSNKIIKQILLLAIPLSIASAISSWSRGALLSLLGCGGYLFLQVKHKFFFATSILIGVFLLLPYLPNEWFARMDTINTYETDGSAMGRIEVWIDGWNYAIRHPFVGAGFDGWRYVTQRDWHSAYVEIFSEHGFIAFGIWLSMLLGSFISLSRLPLKTRAYPELAWVTNYSKTLKSSILAYMIGSAFLGISYWDLLYHLIFISVLIKKIALEELDLLLKTKLNH